MQIYLIFSYSHQGDEYQCEISTFLITGVLPALLRLFLNSMDWSTYVIIGYTSQIINFGFIQAIYQYLNVLVSQFFRV